MAIKRYEVSEEQWSKIALLLPGKASDPGRTGSDNRLFVNGCLWVLRSGAHWRDLPERYGKWKTVHRRFSRWCHAGVWDRVFDALTADRDICGTAPQVRAFSDESAISEGAVICPAFERGVKPLALMKSATQMALSI